ncbi:TetR/AcrR family transcriptional regulator [Glaciihabitans sp. dw_435]|uniref:TetR/AcrR family transcriptional regulator n=1 Tax=Glaciihabitans sp. dw_435 TaxID=2720081 RepID=UPI001BD56679|nr:TetR/AcrR family transcriptional regulator [Glaciihabitans sp. dw_435]
MTAVLTKKGEATRARIIQGSAATIREIGLANTGLDQIRARTGTSQSQLFHYFPEGKAELLLAVADYEATRILDDQRPLLDALTSWTAWEQWSERILETYEREGVHCGLSALTSQLGPNDPQVRAIIGRMYESWEAALAEGLRATQRAGEISPVVNPEIAAAALVVSIQGGIQLLAATGSARHLRAAVSTVIASLRT